MIPGDWRVTGVAVGGCCCQTGLNPAVKTGRQQSRSPDAHNLPCQFWGQTWSGDLVAGHPLGPLVTPCLPPEGPDG